MLPQLTGKETLTIFARIRGVPMGKVKGVVKQTLHAVGVSKDADNRSKNNRSEQ